MADTAAEIMRERAAEWHRIATGPEGYDAEPWDRDNAEQGATEALALADLLDALRTGDWIPPEARDARDALEQAITRSRA